MTQIERIKKMERLKLVSKILPPTLTPSLSMRSTLPKTRLFTARSRRRN